MLRLRQFTGEKYQIDPYQDVLSLVSRLCRDFGAKALAYFPTLFKTRGISIPDNLRTGKDWLAGLRTHIFRRAEDSQPWLNVERTRSP